MLLLTTCSGPRLFDPDAIIEIAPLADGCSIRLMATSGWQGVRESAAQVALMKRRWRTDTFSPQTYALKAQGPNSFETARL